MTKNSYDNQEDLQWVLAIGSGDQQALGKLYDKYAPALTGIIRRIVQKETTADEVLQKVFRHVWCEVGQFDASKHSLFTWMIKMTRQIAIDTVRSAASENPATTHTVYEVAGFTEPLERHMFELLFYKGLTCTEAATVMNIHTDEIKKHVRLAIKNLEPVE